MSDINKIKEMVFETDNKACFIERERILGRLETEMKDETNGDVHFLTPWVFYKKGDN